MAKRKAKAKAKPKILDKLVVGMRVTAPGGKVGFPSAHALYRVTYVEGNEVKSRIVRGAALRTLPGFEDMNGTKAQKARSGITLQYAMEDHIRAAAVLLDTLERVCVRVDEQLGLPDLDWD